MQKHLLLVLLVISLAATGVSSIPDGKILPIVAPEQIGLSGERLARIDRVMNKHVAENRISGAIGLIARGGKIGYFQSWGFLDKEANKPMRKDAIFRIYSMTKAVTGVAAMILFEEGAFFLNDPVSKYMPELGGLKVAVERFDPVSGVRSYSVEAALRDMTVRDLLRHTSGLNYVGPKDEKGESVYQKLGVMRADITIEEAVKRLAKAPLVHQPGTVWDYSLSTDVLGRLVEVLSSMPLDKFFEDRVFKPLGMTDTAFHVPEGNWDRLAALYAPNPDKTVKRAIGPAQESYKKPPTLLSGGGGLVSTTLDYARFCQMLLNGGELGGARILSRKTVELMRSDHLGDMPRAGALLPPGFGFGLTFAVNLGPGKNGGIGSEGEYYWGGAAGTRFWIDPKEEMIGVFMVQILPHTGLTYGSEFKQLAYQAISD